MTSRKKHILFIVLFLTLGVALGSLYLFRCGKIGKQFVQKPVKVESISFSGATVYYTKELFEVPTSLSLGVGMNSSYVPDGVVAYKDYLLRGTLAQQPQNTDPLSMGMKIEIDYSDIDTNKCEINEKNFIIYQYHPNKRDREVSPLRTEIDQKSKRASANITTFPVVENEQINSIERWSYFTLGNKKNRFLAGGCGEDKSYLYLKDNKIHNIQAGYILPYSSAEDVKQLRVSGAEGLGITMPLKLPSEHNVYEMTISTYVSDLPLSKIETLTYGYEMTPQEKIMINPGEKVISRKTDSANNRHILEVKGDHSGVIRIAQMSSFKTGEKQNIYHILEVKVPPEIEPEEYNYVKNYLVSKAESMEFTDPAGF